MNPGEMCEGTIVRGFCIIGKAACGELFHSQMIMKAFTADPFFIAWISAVAFLHVFWLIGTINHVKFFPFIL